MYTILSKKMVNDLIYELKIYAPDVARHCEPGQFVILIPVKGSERVPLTIVNYDRKANWVSIFFQIMGRSTQELATLKVGEKLDTFVGPLGMPSVLHPGKRYLGIAGGVGIAPLYPQIKKLKELGSSVDVIIGAKNNDFLMLTRRTYNTCNTLQLCTDDGSVGFKGFVTDVLKMKLEKGEKYDEIIAIGPVVMMRAVVNITKPLGIPTMVSLNPIMIDGTGMCGCCRVDVGGQRKFACVDGPDFDGLKIDFEKLMDRQRFFKSQEDKKRIAMDEFIHSRKECTCLDDAVKASAERGMLNGAAQKDSQDNNSQLNEFRFTSKRLKDGTILKETLKYETDEYGTVKDIITLLETGEEVSLLAQETPMKKQGKQRPKRKPDMSREKTKIPEQPPLERITNFREVALGYTAEQAIAEARRCLQCKTKPCVKGCPVNVPIPEFINQVAEGNFKAAYDVILQQNKLPAICGRVCPQEKQCEGLCVRSKKGEAVGIGRLERFVADYCMEHYPDEKYAIRKNGHKVAVVGAGPAGITCASELASRGYDTTLFEALHELGGVLTYGIPEFRLPKALVKSEINKVINLGVTVRKNVIVGKSILFEDLHDEGFEAIFLGSGAGLPKFLGIPGEDLNGVYSANEFLTRVNLMKAFEEDDLRTPVITGKNVAVIGGGNVAMDAARTAKRLGAENVYIVYRRSFEELPARREESHHARQELIDFKLLNNPVAILGEEGAVTGVKVQKMELGEPDDSGRRRPVPIEGSEYIIPVDSVIIAIGSTPNPLLKSVEKNLKTNARGCVVINEEDYQTSIKGIYAGGDVVTGAATVILAMGAAKQAAQAIDTYLNQ
ncbi:glutamate synthase (NADPH), homotetrameric [candidate division KSB3 bacterium]|uniref:Glutamate synthase (NADPH), homotetrameric n=1 Tax=candidate division KSB3 bacterium TaxID=2044937 RepID=A0A2G6EDG9_9BACT|nr:MAG: glutamate synthase (NADPH), homotetrameric [candidate division KSB3 bacterium]